jgi:hypothetical protein
MLAPRVLTKRSRIASPQPTADTAALGNATEDERDTKAEHSRLSELLVAVESAMSDWGLSSQNKNLLDMIGNAEEGCECRRFNTDSLWCCCQHVLTLKKSHPYRSDTPSAFVGTLRLLSTRCSSCRTIARVTPARVRRIGTQTSTKKSRRCHGPEVAR